MPVSAHLSQKPPKQPFVSQDSFVWNFDAVDLLVVLFRNVIPHYVLTKHCNHNSHIQQVFILTVKSKRSWTGVWISIYDSSLLFSFLGFFLISWGKKKKNFLWVSCSEVLLNSLGEQYKWLNINICYIRKKNTDKW